MVDYLAKVLRFSAVFIFGSTGEIITEKSGHLNLGIPGVMCVGAAGGGLSLYVYLNSLSDINAMSGFLVVFIPLIFSMLFAAVAGVIYSFLTVTLRANQNITGLALTTFGMGVTSILFAAVDTKAVLPKASSIYLHLFGGWESLGWFGEIFLSHGILVYLAIITALIVAFVLKRTRVGLNLRAVGENPATADAAGISVTKYRYLATIVGSMIAGIGGLFYLMDNCGGNWENCSPIESLGWLSIAIVIFTTWKPDLSILGSIAFSALSKLASATSAALNIAALVNMLPYVMTIIVLIITSIVGKKSSQPPESLGLNYFREER